MTPIGRKILELLALKQIAFERIQHAPAETCFDSSALRGHPQSIGGKSILFKSQHGFVMIVLAAHLRIDSGKVRHYLKSSKLRFASKEELFNLAGVVKGALPPFGNGLLDIEMHLDRSLCDNQHIAFNCGVLTESVVLKMEDYLSLISAPWCDCAATELDTSI
ncbi:YbaK/EbsC family protein [Echinimonas agarilytica]|uniref:YbaK/aminoacyl-tRNA synthetase-associated domain-containing protein n=1 Tax=Echinimonas agarilytica TaxID=1215918 RepID=A0AA42B6I9_9GAMM|nr:YbaK/EbsC family protein [Echinimonas agarilytica]MCM2678593.1 hypothetical protein [Echinimonas agarilytica]